MRLFNYTLFFTEMQYFFKEPDVLIYLIYDINPCTLDMGLQEAGISGAFGKGVDENQGR